MVDLNDPKGAMSGREKTCVALAAAMGGGCRTCAERLSSVARSQKMTDGEIEWAFAQGLEAKQSGTELMREKASELTGGDPQSPAEPGSLEWERLGELAQLAAAVAANAAPEARRHIELAKSAGATESAIGVAVAIGRTIRGKAQGFSDEELDERNESDDRLAVSCCGV
jgi:alkylhydroperoxidase/carboxymuconolactone decarboxylase family protein YurZ